MAEFIYHILIERQLWKGGTNEILLKKLASFYYRAVSCEAAAAMTGGVGHGPMLPPCLFPSPSRGCPPVHHLPSLFPRCWSREPFMCDADVQLIYLPEPRV